MVRTGQRAAALRELLEAAGFQSAAVTPAPPRLHDLEADLAGSILTTYRTFGGTEQDPALRPGAWDLAFEDGLVIELDEELHFNRYRGQTLSADWADALPWQTEYLRQSEAQEAFCLSAGSWGKRWTNPSCERMFGTAAEPRSFKGGGAPRWKQRALYDSMKDAAALSNSNLRLARLSVFDTVNGTSLASLLGGSATILNTPLRQYLERRIL
jgi:hypothetical protein